MSYPNNTVTITLDHPYKTQGGADITAVTMRAPTVRDRILRARDRAGDIEADIRMIALLCGMGYDDILNMEGSDYLRLELQFNAFLKPAEKSAKETSLPA